MSEKRDYYEVLGVARDAAGDDVKKAYRQAALKNHPDRNPGDAAAEARFKEASEAYAVLSDAEKRQAYDRFGHAGVGRGADFSHAGVGDILSQFQDLFSDFFGGGGGFGRQERRGPPRGADVRVEATLSLAEAMEGVKREVTVTGQAPCGECSGSGALSGTKPEPCVQCGGAGQVSSNRGFIMFTTTCPRCRGAGQVIAKPCPKCRGSGAEPRQKAVVVTFPAGIDAGQRLRVSGQGMPAPGAGQPGDLYVDVDVAPHPEFERHGQDLATKAHLTFPDAVLGAEVPIKLPTGKQLVAEIPAGTQPGAVLTLEGEGLPFLDRRGRGSLHVVVDVEVPRKLSKKARKLVQELAEELASREPPARSD